MDIQRLRNLTTGILHTKMDHIYKDLEWITGEPEIFTHMIPRVFTAVRPWLREVIKDPRFWDDKFDLSHTGTFELPTPTKSDRKLMFERFVEQPNPLANKEVMLVYADE